MNIRAIFYRVVLCCLLVPVWCAAVKPYATIYADPMLEPWRWRNEESLEGLGVVCMDEAHDGSLWFGNAGSIAHYDGVKVTRILFEDDLLSLIPPIMKTPRANAIAVLPDGNPLMLIERSLVLRSGDTWRVIIEDTGPSVFTGRLECADDGTIWLIVPGALWRISEDLSDVSMVMKASGHGFLGSFCLDAAGDVWVVEKTEQSHSQLVRIPIENGLPEETSKWEKYPVPIQSAAVELSITAGQDDRIWYADDSENTSIARFDSARKEWSLYDAFPKARFFSLYTGNDGAIWAGGEEVIFRVPPEGEPFLYSVDQLQQPQVPLSMHETKNNRLWVIGRIGYVHSVDIGFNQWMTYEQLHLQCETSEGTLWFRSKQKDAVVSHDTRSGVWLQYDYSDGLIDTVSAMIATSHGLVWAAGSHQGRAALAVFDGENWVRLLHPEFAEWIEPKALMEAKDGTVWFGAGGAQLLDVPGAGGALQYGVDDAGKMRLLKHHRPPDFPYYVTALAQAPDHTIWVGSTLVYCYDGLSPVASARAEFYGLNTIDIVLDHQQTFWIAKEHAGVYQDQGNSWKLFSTPEGLAGVSLSDLLVLQDGSILAATGSGISRFDGKTWTSAAFPEWWIMSRRWSGMHQSADDTIWFNFEEKEAQPAQLTLNQTERFRTIRYRAESTPPDTRITDYLKRVAQPGNSHIKWAAYDPWGESSREELQYSWRLNEGEWSAFSHDTSRTFLDLCSGLHVLEVRARDRSFNVDPTPDRIEFSVIPSIWKQAWFMVLISSFSALVVVLIWMYVRVRERHLLEQQREREKHLKEMDQLKTSFFTNISHELRTPVTLITGPLKRMLESERDEQKRSMISMALRNATRVWNLATQLLDFRKLEQGKMEVVPVFGKVAPYVTEIVELFQSMAQTNHVKCRTVCDEEIEGFFDPEMLKKIIQNLVGNAIKYTASGGSVAVSLEGRVIDEQRMLILAVEDTGSGIKPEHLLHVFERFYRIPEKSIVDGSGIGLNLTKELVDLLGGTIQAESPIHTDTNRPGSRFTVVFPLNANESGDDKVKAVQDDGYYK